jgi:hypothetical protein
MASQITQPSATGSTAGSSTPARKRPWRIGFFTVMPAVILFLVVAGFTRTLFARPVFHPAPIPPYLYLHGIMLTTWFVWALVQSLLISAGRVANHRRLGTIGAFFAAAVVVAALMASFGSVSRRPFDLDAPASIMGTGLTGITVAQFRSSVVWGNIVNAVSFAVFIVSGVILRKRAQVHKRMMVFASISIVEPALARIARWPMMGGEQGPLIPIVVWSLIAAVAIHELLTRKRLATSTILGIIWLFIVRNGAQYIADSSIGLSLIYALK